MVTQYYDFERPIQEIEQRLTELQGFPAPSPFDQAEIARLTQKLAAVRADVYRGLSRWQKTLVARHMERPYTLDYVQRLCTEFVELHGDRLFADDAAMVGGLARFKGEPIVVVGHQKGRTTKEKIARNFGMTHPEGNRKALRLMHLGAKFGRPVLAFIDTPGAYPGVGAEERGQSEAIARNLREMALLRVPIVSVVIGEGGSGGALALGVADRVFMLEYAIYSVISPEGCAAILWKDAARGEAAAEALRLTAPDALELGVIDAIIPEPPGGAHRDYDAMAWRIAETVDRAFRDLRRRPVDNLLAERHARFQRVGRFVEAP